MALTGNGTSQYISLGTAVTIVQSPPITFAALIDTTSLRAGGVSGSEWNSIIQQGIYQASGWDVEIENGASNNRLNLSAKATGGTAFDAFGPTVTANTGWWLVAGVLRDTGTNFATDLYTYRYNTGALSLLTTATFSRGTNGTLPAPTGLTTLMAQNGTTDWFPGAFGWVAVWNVDLFGAGAANPPALQSLIAEGPFSQADSSLKGLWLNDGDVTDYSTGGHNGTLINAPAFIGAPVNYRPLVMPYRTTATAGGVAPQALVGSAQADTAASGVLTITPAAAQPLTGTASSATAVSGALTQTPAAAQALVGSAASATVASGAFTQTAASAQALVGSAASVTAASAALTETPAAAQTLVGSASSATSATGALSGGAPTLNFVGTAASASAAAAALSIATAAAQNLVGAASAATAARGTLTQSGVAPQALTGSAGSATAAAATLTETPVPAQPLIGTASSVTTASGVLTQTPAAAQHLVGTAASATSASGALGAETANFEIGVNNAGTGGNDMSPAVVRDSSNRLWRAAFTAAAYTNSGGANNGNTLRMFRCNTTGMPSAFAEQDSAHRPTNVGSFSIAIDGSDLIHVAFVHTYTAATTGIYYTTFNTSTNLWSGVETKIGTVNYPATTTYVVGDAGVAMALDAAGIPHVVSYGQVSGTGATHIFYTNKIGGTWSSAVQLDTATLGTNQRCMHPACMFDSTGALHVAWMTITADYGTTLEHAYYIKRSSGGTFGSVTQFAENLLGSIDNGPSLYVSEDDHIHIAYGLGDGTTPGGQTVTGTTVNNSVFYRFSANGGTAWNTTTQPAHYVSHDFAIGPSGDDAGGIHLWSHSQPTTVDGVGTAIGYATLPGGSSTWVAWSQKANAASLGYDCTVSPRREQFFHNGVKYLDLAYFALDLPLSAMLGSDPSGLVVTPMTGSASSATAASGVLTLTPAAPQPLTGSALSQSAAAATLTQVPAATQTLAGSAASASAASAALTIAAAAQSLVGSAASQSAAGGALTQTPAAAQGLTGSAASATAAAAALTETPTGPQPLVGTAGSATSARGTLTLTNPSGILTGAATAATSAQGALTIIPAAPVALVGAASSASSASSALTQSGQGAQQFVAMAISRSSASGMLSITTVSVVTEHITMTDVARVGVRAVDSAMSGIVATDRMSGVIATDI